jgi:hypothetical protein
MADNESKQVKPDGKRIAGARVKGADAALRGKPYSNPYERANMAAAFQEGFDSVPESKRGSKVKAPKAKPAAE